MTKSDILTQVRQMYDESAGLWNQTRTKKYRQTGTANWPVLQKFVDRLKAGQSLLDVGCGNGRLITGLPEGVEYTGIDFSQTLLEVAKKNFPDKNFIFGNIAEKRTWNELGQYDAVFCVAVFHHIPEREQQIMILKEMRNACKGDGFLFLSVWNLWQERFLQNHLDSIELKKINDRYVEVPFAGKWKRFCVQMDIPYLTELMEESGWNIEEIFFADRAGAKADIRSGENIIVIAK